MQGHHEAYLLSAGHPDEMEDWMAAIKDSVLSNPLHQLIASRAKSKMLEKEKEKREREREWEKEKERQRQRQDKGFYLYNYNYKLFIVILFLLFMKLILVIAMDAKVDLNLLHEMANMCSACYKNANTIKELYPLK